MLVKRISLNPESMDGKVRPQFMSGGNLDHPVLDQMYRTIRRSERVVKDDPGPLLFMLLGKKTLL